MTLGIIFALLGSLSFSMNAVSIRRGVTRGAASQGLYLTVFSGTVLFLIASVIAGQIFDAGTVSGRDFAFMAAAGVVHILGGRYCNYRAMGAIGSNRSQPIVGTSTLVSIGIAILFLNEQLDWIKGIGIVLVMAGPALAAPRRRASAPAAPVAPASATGQTAIKAFTPKVVEGYVFGVMTAVLWGAGPVLMRAGVDSNGLGVLGGTVAYGSASLVLLATLAIPGQASGAIKLDKGARGMFLVGGFSSWLANMFRFSALALAPVSIIIPLMRSSVLFSLVMNWFFNRHLESFEPKVIGGILISMVGAVLLVIDI